MTENPFGFLIESLLGKETFDELDALEGGKFKTRMSANSNTMQRHVATLMADAEEAGASDRVLWLLVCSPIAAMISSTLLNLMEHYHEGGGPNRPTMLDAGAALSAICSIMVRRGLSHIATSLRDGEPTPQDIGLLNAHPGDGVSAEKFKRVMLAAGLPIGPEDSEGSEFLFLNRLGVALFGETVKRSPVQVGMGKMPDGTNVDMDRQSHGIEITGDTRLMAKRMAAMFQEVARAVSGFYIADGRSEDGLNITNHALAMCTAYCSTLAVNVIRSNTEDGANMTRLKAARIYIQAVVDAADEAIVKAVGELDRQDAIAKFPDARPQGEA
jgi:hypothetical protein